MKTFKYNVGDTYPNIAGKLSYSGSVTTTGMSAVLLANGNDTGPFTGTVSISEVVSDNPSMSYINFIYEVIAADSQIEGSYKLCLRITHPGGKIETKTSGALVKVSNDCGEGA